MDVAAVVGLAAAVRATARELTEVNDRVLDYPVTLQSALSLLPGCRLTAPDALRLAGTVHVTFEGIAGDELLFLLDEAGVYASAAASCSSGATESSHVLSALGLAPEWARGSLRLSMGAETTEAEEDELITVLASVVYRLRRAA